MSTDRLKKVLHKLYGNLIVRMTWDLFVRVVNQKHISFFLRRALNEPKNHSGDLTGVMILPDTNYPSGYKESKKKKVLIVVPFYGSDAASVYNDYICESFCASGYEVYAIVYNNDEWEPRSRKWNYVYHVKSSSFGVLPTDLDSNLIDDWVGSELTFFVAGITKELDFQLCVVAYPFLSKVFDFVDKKTKKILLTHDVFANRNSKIKDLTSSNEGFYFSTSRDEEKKGLKRSDLVIAIRVEDEDYYRSEYDLNVVKTVPYFEPRKVDREVLLMNLSSPIRFFYFASGHKPNVDALLELATCLKDLESEVVINVFGSICSALEKNIKIKNIRTLGYVDDIEEFYKSSDGIFVNPDMLDSGLKIKCVEALMYGKPLICTASSSKGMHAESEFHTLKDIRSCAKMIDAVSKDEDKIKKVQAESIKLYDEFEARYVNSNGIDNYYP